MIDLQSYEPVYKRRQKDEKPVVEGFIRWLNAQHPERGSRLDRTVTYIRSQRDMLTTYLEDGRCSLSNNLSENADLTGFTIHTRTQKLCR